MDIAEEIEITRYKNWIHTMNLKNFLTKEYNLIKECSNLLLLLIFDFLEPENIKWKIIEKNPNNKYRKLANFNHFFSKITEKNLDFTSIGSTDIVEGKKDKIFSILWALMRYHYFKNLKRDQKIDKINESDLKKWAEKFNSSNFYKKTNENQKNEVFQIKEVFDEKIILKEEEKKKFEKVILSLEDKNDEILACEDRELFYNEIIKEDFGFTINFDDFDKDLKSFESSQEVFGFSLTEKFEKDYKKIEILPHFVNNKACLNIFKDFKKKIDYCSENRFLFKKKEFQPLKKIYETKKFFKDKIDKKKNILNLNLEISSEKSKKILKKQEIYSKRIIINLKEKKIQEIKIKKNLEKINKIEKPCIIDTLKMENEESILYIPKKKKILCKKKTKNFSNHKESVLLFIKPEKKEIPIISNFENSIKKDLSKKTINSGKKNLSKDLKIFLKKTNLNLFYYLKHNLEINDLLKKKIFKLIIQKKCFNLQKYQKEENLSNSSSKIMSSNSFKKKFENLNNISKRNKILFPLILQRKMSLKNKKIEEICQKIKKIGIFEKKEIFYDSKKIGDIKLLKPYYYNIVMKKIVNRNNEKVFNFPKSTIILKEYKKNKRKFENFKDYLEHCFQ